MPVPEMHPANVERAGWALVAVDAFARETFAGRTFSAEPDKSMESDAACMLSDLIGDILHLADRHGLDALGLLERGRAAYEYEAAPDYEGD